MTVCRVKVRFNCMRANVTTELPRETPAKNSLRTNNVPDRHRRQVCVCIKVYEWGKLFFLFLSKLHTAKQTARSLCISLAATLLSRKLSLHPILCSIFPMKLTRDCGVHSSDCSVPGEASVFTSPTSAQAAQRRCCVAHVLGLQL